MSEGSALLSSLYSRGVQIWEDNGQLRYQAPPGVLLPEDLRELCRLTSEISGLLKLTKSSLYSPVQPRERGSPVPLTAFQLSAWKNLTNVEAPRRAANCITSVRVLGVLDTGLLRRCIDTVVQRHESLRTRIVAVNGIPRQHVVASSEYSLQTVDVSHVARDTCDEVVEHLGQQFVQETVDVSLGPMFRAKLFRLSDTEHVLFSSTDHLVSDGASKRIVEREIWTLYDRSLRGLPLSLEDLPVQFADYAIWQERTHHDWLKDHGAYWRDHLRGAPSLRLPIDNSIRTIETADISVQRFSFGNETTGRLRALARKERTLLSTVVLSVYILAISYWCNQKDLVLAVVSDGRVRPELEHITGFVATYLLLRVQILDTDSLLQLLKRTEAELYSALDHYDYYRAPSLVPECRTEAAFNFMPDSVGWSPMWQWAESITSVKVCPYPFVQIIRRAFIPLFYYTDADVLLTVHYCKNFVSSNTVDSFAKYVRVLARELARNPNSHIAAVVAREVLGGR